MVLFDIYVAISLRFYASGQVLVLFLLTVGLLMSLYRPPRTAAIILVSLAVIVGLVTVESDNYVQFGTLKIWGPPPVINMCGITRHPTGVTSRIGRGDGPIIQRITTTPSGLSVFGASGCPETPLYMQDGNRFLVYQ